VREPRAPICTTPSDGSTACIGPTSITTPSVEERPAKQWPPLRTATWPPRARSSASTTSAALAHRTIAAGCAPAKRVIAGRRAASYASDPGRSTSTPTP
jgi:hypothetical protein